MVAVGDVAVRGLYELLARDAGDRFEDAAVADAEPLEQAKHLGPLARRVRQRALLVHAHIMPWTAAL
jgi:hypothetical protein